MGLAVAAWRLCVLHTAARRRQVGTLLALSSCVHGGVVYVVSMPPWCGQSTVVVVSLSLLVFCSVSALDVVYGDLISLRGLWPFIL